MPIVSSFGALKSLDNPPLWSGTSGGSLSLYGGSQSYADLYRTQPNVRICVDFLARNIGELSIHVFRRVSDTDRERLVDHEIAEWLGNPNYATVDYRLIESLVGDLALNFNAYWLKVRTKWPDGRPRIGLARLPPEEMEVKGGILPSHYLWTSNGREKEFNLSEIVYFNGYNPLNPLMGLSLLETLRRVLAEDSAASVNREAYWLNGSRMESVITQDAAGPNYNPAQLTAFREQLQEFAGRGSKVGAMPLLPKGFDIKSTSFSAKDSEYIQGGKLRREVCAAAWHIPLPLVGILDHATFSNIKEQHKHLYQDCLGPWLKMIKREIERQLLVECEDQKSVYIEFNLDAKLAGTPEERANSLQVSVGKPWRTVNEARALENLPRDPDPESDKIAAQQGGPSSNGRLVPTDDEKADAIETVLRSASQRQVARLAKLDVSERVSAFQSDLERWNRELTADLTPLVGEDEAESRAFMANVRMLSKLNAEAKDA